MHVTFPQLLPWHDVTLLLLRLLIGLIFGTSGWSHMRDPVGRGASIGLPPGVTRILGVAEMAGAIGVAAGVFPQLAAFGLILVMLGAIQKKIFVWHTGFWGERTYGWHYDLLLLIGSLVIATSAGGRFVLG